jgi:hypothetical protein
MNRNGFLTHSSLIYLEEPGRLPVRRDNLKKFATLSCANVQYSYWPQLTLTLFWQTEM